MRILTNRHISLVHLTAANIIALAIYACAIRIGESNWLTTLIAYAPALTFGLSTAALLLLSTLKRKWGLVVVDVTTLVALAVALSGLNLLPRPDTRPHGAHIRIMTYNIRAGRNGVAGVAQTMLSNRPDIICMQEVYANKGARDPMPRLRELLPHDWASVHRGELAIFSKYPIVGHRYHSSADLGVLEATLDTPSGRLTVLTTHLSLISPFDALPWRDGKPVWQRVSHANEHRWRQMRILLSIARSIRTPLIVTGDFNTPPHGLLYSAATSTLKDAFRAAGRGWGYTYPCVWPLWRIDYVLVIPRIGVRDCFVPPSQASNHRPLVADITVPQ